eukprot:2379417-Pleurochrysis_carterae.AAC.1
MVDASTQSEPLDALLDALIRAREVARSSAQAAARVSDPNTGVEHHHTPPRASGSKVLTVRKPSHGPGRMVNTLTKREPLCSMNPLPLSLRGDSPQLAILSMSTRPRVKHHHTPQRAIAGAGGHRKQ